MWPCQPAASWVSEAGNPPEVVQKCKTICTKKATLSFFFTSSSHFTSSMISLALVSSNCNFYTSFNLGTEVPYVLVLLLLRDLHHIVILCRCRTYICSSHTHTHPHQFACSWHAVLQEVQRAVFPFTLPVLAHPSWPKF